LFDGATLDHLKDGPRLYLTSTNLATGNMFSFVAGGGDKSEMGEHELGFVDAPNFSIARAVAASSAFPPVFPPLVIDSTQFPAAANVSYVSLTDGGVYDNLGVGPGLGDRNGLSYLFASDAGKPFEIDTRPTTDGAIVLVKAIDILMEQVRGLQFDRLLHRSLAKVGPKPLWFSIDSKEGEAHEGDSEFASAIKTNLSALTKTELKTLKRHGASLFEARLAKYAPELIL
jgi:NTE family protein